MVLKETSTAFSNVFESLSFITVDKNHASNWEGGRKTPFSIMLQKKTLNFSVSLD